MARAVVNPMDFPSMASLIGSALPPSSPAYCGSMVAIHEDWLTDELETLIKHTFRYTNPAYISAVRFGNIYAPKPPQFINEYTKEGSYYIVPRAAGVDLIGKLKLSTLGRFFDQRATFPDLLVELQAHQLQALENFVGSIDTQDLASLPFDGYISFQPGAGKTITALACILAAKAKTLIVVPTQEIERTWLSDISKTLGIPESAIGRVRGSTIDTTKALTVGSIQTLMRLPEALWGNQFGMLVVDEVHRMGAKVFCNVVRNSAAAIRLGLTATDYRKDGAFNCVKQHIGTAIISSNTRYNVVPLQYHMLVTPYGIIRNKPEFTFNDLLEDLQNNADRTDLIIRVVEHILDHYEGDILIVSPRTAHLESICARLSGSAISNVLVTGSTKGRSKVFQDICAGVYKVTVSTTSIMSEGASNPRWHHVISTMPFSDKKQAIQLSGRACRQGPNKEFGIFWDLVDANPMAKAMYRARWRALAQYLSFTRTYDTTPTITLRAEHKGKA